MRSIKRKLTFAFIGIIALAILYASFYFIFLDLIVDFWWFSSLDFQDYFWLRLFYKYLIFGGITLFVFIIFFLHFWIAARFLGIKETATDAPTGTNTKKSKSLFAKFQTGALEVYVPLSLVMSIIIALPFFHHWEEVLLYIFAPSTGIEEPVFGYDVGFYMFSYPIYQLIQKYLLGISVLLFVFVAVLYWVEHRIFSRQVKTYPTGVKIHLGILITFVCLFVVWGFLLDRFSLLYSENHEPVFYGPGFIEIRYQLPLIWLSIVSFILVAIAIVQLIYSHGKKGRKPLIAFIISFLVIMGLRTVHFIPNLIDKFIVQPNPVKAEKPFMQNNITATLTAYNLDKVNTVEIVPTLAPLDDLLNWEGKKYLDNVPLWDREILRDVYFQLQGIRPYYNFVTVDEDRYLINDILKQVNLSAREINTSRLPQEAQNWENNHLRYTHGYGAVVSPAAQPGGQPLRWFLRDLDMHSTVGFDVKNPDIYYGMENYKYAIVPNNLAIADIASGSEETSSQFPEKSGIPVRSLFRKMLFAFYFREERIFFSVNLNNTSRVRFRRNINERITKLAPFLNLDSDPYLVVTQDVFYWIQDAYTISNWYPVSKRLVAPFKSHGKEENKSFNYIRNSVKIVINAYDGSVNFYIADPEDSIIQAYNRAYPQLFKPLNALPADLKSHLRYPRDMFYQQMKIYRRYHQVEPELFYQQANTWEFSIQDSKKQKPYYLTTALQGCPSIDSFVLLSLMTPIARDNLSGFATAGLINPEECGMAYSPAITMFTIRDDIQLDGPRQINALIDQDPVISEQLALWDQHGSNVIRGRMILLPVGSTVLYLQPVYLVSTQTKIPELARVIVATGGEVIMQKSSSGAFKQLKVKLGAEPEPVPKPKPKPVPKPKPAPLPVPEPEPEPEPEPIVEEPEVKEPFIKFVLAGDISFAYGKVNINPGAEIKLGEIADTIKEHQNIIVLINGYTDSKGNPASNLRLSTKRAERVKQWLIENKGIQAEILFAKGYGSEKPVADNTLADGSDNPSGREKNRRVEIIIEKTDPQS